MENTTTLKNKKDPAFLWYSKDWLQGTAELSPAEKGVYADLLSHQHQSENLPTDVKRLARMAGLSLEEFTPIWEVLESKFEAIDTPQGKRLVNHKLIEVVEDRKENALKTRKNRIVGIFGGLCRGGVKDGMTPDQIQKIKDEFSPDDFMTIDEAKLSMCLSDWFHKRLPSCQPSHIPSLEDEDGIEDGNLSSSLVLSSSLDNPTYKAKLISRFGLTEDDFTYCLERHKLSKVENSKVHSTAEQARAAFEGYILTYVKGKKERGNGVTTFIGDNRSPKNHPNGKMRENQILTNGQEALMDSILDGKIKVQ